MDPIAAIVLAVVQALTEFLPVSSSAHLILVPELFGWPDQGLAFDVALHMGTLGAVVLYFRRDLFEIISATLLSLRNPAELLRNASAIDPQARLGWQVALSIIPAGIAGLLFDDYISTELRSPLIIAANSVVFGVALWAVDRRGGTGRDEFSLTFAMALLIGIAQAMALVPGTSRSGITITAGMALGLSRQAAARFSFLMAAPVIFLAGLFELRNVIQSTDPVQWDMMAIGAAVSLVVGFMCIRAFLGLLNRMSLAPFAVYRLCLAAVILVMFA